MVNCSNRFFHGFALNDGNNKSCFKHYIIESARELRDYSGEPIIETIIKMEDFYFDDERIGSPFYMVYGAFKTDSKRSSMVIGSFSELSKAIDLVENLSGNCVTETEQPVYRLPS